ncbi:MAG: hypothetical protein ACR2KC_01180 [Acidimicrobiales bacterium]
MTAPALWILAPLRLEARAVAAGAPNAVVHRSGMGPRRSASTLTRLIARHPTPAAVAIAGVAGGLAEGVLPGDVVVADAVLDESGVCLLRPEGADAVASGLRQVGLTVHVGPIISTPKLTTGRKARARLGGSGALAVDMESAFLLAHDWQVPVVVVRAISDTPEADWYSTAVLRNGPKALRALRAAGPVLQAWADALPAR